MKPLKLCVVLLVLACAASAEDKPALKVVRVTGTSEVMTVPDRAVIELGVEKQSASASTAKATEDAVARKILAGLHAKGIDDKDIQTTYLSLRPETVYQKKVRLSYFVAEQTLTVTVRDLTKLDTLLESLIHGGGNRIDSIRYETSDLRKYRDQARDLAVKAAREKAGALAAALGQEIGRAQYIEEVADNPYAGAVSNVSSYYNDSPERSRAPATAAGRNTISASVIVSFELN